jgi:putative ABC transport system permease protein
MIEDYMKIVLRSLLERGIRTWLTMIGIFIGIAAVVGLVSLGTGLQASINEQFEMMGANKILIFPGGGFFGIGGGAAELTEADLDAIEDVRGVKRTLGSFFKIGRVEFRGETEYTWVIGVPTDESQEVFLSMSSVSVEKGRKLKTTDRNKVIVGWYHTSGNLFDDSVDIGDKITVEGEEFKVVGSFGRIGNPQDDSQVYMPIETARELLNEPVKFDFIFVEARDGFDTKDVADRIKKELRDFRDVEEGEEDFTVETSEQLKETYSTIINIVNYVVVGLAAISLFVGGLGIMNVMYTSVLERTQEIGVMKAIGARNSHILILFLLESGFLGIAGGAVGIAVGVGFSQLTAYGAAAAGWSFLKVTFPWYLIIGAFAFSFIVGCIAGALPAMQAAKLKPVEALRYE